jgi:hypothetical protein
MISLGFETRGEDHRVLDLISSIIIWSVLILVRWIHEGSKTGQYLAWRENHCPMF